MAQLWGGRFTKETDKLVYNFNASISFDQKFYRQDIEHCACAYAWQAGHFDETGGGRAGGRAEKDIVGN